MADFTVRIEWDKISPEEDFRLTYDMAQAGYVRFLTDRSGDWFELPQGEFVTSKNMSATEVRAQVINIAKLIRASPRVLVTESTNRAWQLIRH